MFKRIITIALACVIAVAYSITCFAETEMKLVKKDLPVPQKTVVLGDSIAAGYGLEGYADGGVYPPGCYASILGEKFEKELKDTCPSKVINYAVSGYTSADLLAKLRSGAYHDGLLGSNAVVVSIGGNDIMGPALQFLSEDLGLKTEEDIKNFNTANLAKPSVIAKIKDRLETVNSNLSDFKNNLKEIISAIRAETTAPIVFQTVYDPLAGKEGIKIVADLMAEKINALNQIIIDNSKDITGNDVYLICDVYEGFKGKESEYTNIDNFDIHPSAEGHKVISELVDKQLRTQKYSYEDLVEVKDEPKQKMTTAKIYIMLAVFFGGFITLFVIVWIRFKRDTR